MDDFVHDYFSVDKLRKAYSGLFNPMISKHFWQHVDLGYKIKKPKLRRSLVGQRKLGLRHQMNLMLGKERGALNAMN